MRWLLFILLPVVAWAHPVIYDGGTVLWSMSMKDMTQATAMYSFTPKWSAGAEYWRMQDPKGEDKQWQFAKLNHLAYRYNGQDSQANVYLHSGVGRSDATGQENRFGWMAGAETDWETREYFLSAKYMHLAAADYGAEVWVGRIGYSPFKAAFDQLQSWVMLQAWYDPITSRETKLTPLLRFFYRNVLWELGSSTKGDMFLNWMVHI